MGRFGHRWPRAATSRSTTSRRPRSCRPLDQDGRKGAPAGPESGDGLSNVVPRPRLSRCRGAAGLVLDCGGQYSQLIARRVRECRVYSELVSHRITPEAVQEMRPLALVSSGGPAWVYAEDAPGRPADLRARHTDARHLLRDAADGPGSGRAGRADRGLEFGKTELSAEEGELFANLPSEQIGWMSHRDSVTAPPEGRAWSPPRR